MEKQETLFKKDAIFLLDDGKDYTSDEILEFIGGKLTEAGYAKESFVKALKDREERFPTGLATEPYAIAIPHSDLGHVNVPCIGVVKLRGTAQFREMVDTEKKVRAKFVFCIALSEKEKQTDILQEIMGIASDEVRMKRLAEAADIDMIYEILCSKK